MFPLELPDEAPFKKVHISPSSAPKTTEEKKVRTGGSVGELEGREGTVTTQGPVSHS